MPTPAARINPECCGAPMSDATTPIDLDADAVRWLCGLCGRVGYDAPRYEGGRPPPAAPTSARPGSEEKIIVLIERQSAGVALHHPADASTSVLRPQGRRSIRDLPEGICWDKKKRKYRARGRIGSHRVLLGLYATVAEAQQAIEDARRTGQID